ncbi:hypothetical protein ACHAW5_009198 [Stephanodiscus triporus]|uniref:Uncharacterized protein n=1 Tax=Stephanodiscus triporus TaxID=2934178 RepID=A0ABD3N0W5_9STRA
MIILIHPPSLPPRARRGGGSIEKNKIPETKTTEDGSPSRNITRKHDHDPHKKEKKQHGGAGGKGKWNELDDGSE